MEYRTLDVTVVSAEDLKKVTSFGKLQPYAVVWVDPHQRRTTRVAKDGHSNPTWNERFSFSVPEHLLHQSGSSLHIEIYSKGSFFGNKFVGMAMIPLSDLVRQSDAKEIQMYQLRRRSGKVKGAVRLSVNMGEKMTAPGNTGYPGMAAASSEPVTAYPSKPYAAPGYGGYPQAYPPQQPYQAYPPQGYYPPPQQGYYQQPPNYQQQPPRRPGMMGGMGGMGTGLLAGALGGLLVGEMLDNSFDGGYGGGFDGGGFDGGGFDGGF